MNNNRIEINLQNGYRLVAEANIDPNYPNEIYVGIINDNGQWIQDLAIIQNDYSYNDDGDIVYSEDKFNIYVYEDNTQEDYTNKFNIDLWRG